MMLRCNIIFGEMEIHSKLSPFMKREEVASRRKRAGSMPVVSVVIPTFGRPDLVSRAVNSVLGQTMGDLELIVVVDGEDPATVAVLDSIAEPRLRRIVQSV